VVDPLAVVGDGIEGCGGGDCMFISFGVVELESMISRCSVFVYVNTGVGGGEKSGGVAHTRSNAVS
jgi:hypothetical protein